MGSSSSAPASILRPQELIEYRKLDGSTGLDQLNIPERTENRSCTNKAWLIGFIFAVLFSIPGAIYILVNSDYRRLTHGTDSCGNICGYLNPKIDGFTCSGEDYRDKQYAVQSQDSGYADCVTACPSGYLEVFYLCIKESADRSAPALPDQNYANQESNASVKDTSFDYANFVYLHNSWYKVLFSTWIAILVALGGVYLFRYATAFVVWTAIVLCVSLFALAAIAGWIGASNGGSMTSPIIFTIASLILFCMCIGFYERIKLLISLFKEATKAFLAMPLLALVPVISVLVDLLVLVALATLALAYLSTRTIVISDGKHIQTVSHEGFDVFIGYSAIITLWILQFFGGIHYMVIGGSVSTWYFAENKSKLNSPILTSIKNTICFHLGSIALGSLITTLVTIVRALIRSLAKNRAGRAALDCILRPIEEILKYFTKNAYIVTALHGQPFLKSGKRAGKLLLANAESVVTVNWIGDLVRGMVALVLVAISTGLSYLFFMDSDYFATPLLICFLLNCIVICVTFGIFDTIIDTLFMCFCEDKVLNDGISRPYAMSRDLMQYVENSKAYYVK